MYFHHPSLLLHPEKSTTNLQAISSQRGAIRQINWARKRPAASAKNMTAEQTNSMNEWMYLCHPSLLLHPKKSTKYLQPLSLQCGAIRYRNWARKRPAASAKKYESQAEQLMDGWMYFHHPSLPLHRKQSTKYLQSLSLQRGAIRYRNWPRKQPAASEKKCESRAEQLIRG